MRQAVPAQVAHARARSDRTSQPDPQVDTPTRLRDDRSGAPANAGADSLPLAQHSFQVAAGTVIARDNVDSFAPLLSPGLRWAVRSGLRMKIVEPRPVAAPEAYRRATAEKCVRRIYSRPGRVEADGARGIIRRNRQVPQAGQPNALS